MTSEQDLEFDEFMKEFVEDSKPKPVPEETEKSWLEWASKPDED